MKRKIFISFLIFIFLLALFLRFYKLGEIPYGFYQDESAIGYNAYSILETGKDEHGQFLPLYFKSFGDYKLPLYIYATIIPIKLFGLTEFAVRFPSALFGFLTVIVFYFFVKQMTQNQKLAIFATVLLAINPWHLHYSRTTFEVSLSLFLFVLGALLLNKVFISTKRGAFLLGTLCFVINAYTYNLTRFLSPVLFMLLIFTHKKRLVVVSKRELVATIVVSILLLIPFLSTIFQSGGFSSTAGTGIFTSAAVQAPLLEFRSYLLSLPSFFVKGFFNSLALTVWQYFNNILSYFSVSFFFVSGSSHGNHGIGNVGQFYLFEFPLIIMGIIQLFRQKTSWGKFLVWWAALVILVASLTREIPHATRSFFFLLPFPIFSAFGLLFLWSWWQGTKSFYKKGVLFGVLILVFYNIFYYFISYYVRFPVAYAKAWRATDKQLSLYLKENQNKYDRIVFDKEAGFIYTSLLFFTAYPPEEFQKTVKREPDDSEGWSHVTSFGKYKFKEIDWSKDYETKNTLLITTMERKPQEAPPLLVFYYPRRPVVLSLKQEIIQYPVEEIAYVLVKSR